MNNTFISNHFDNPLLYSKDEYFMGIAIEEAKKGEGFVHPNPLVGAVIEKDGKILARGYHHKYGLFHAERDALKNAEDSGQNVKGATIYVTLEPCCHQGKQPPCTDAIIRSGINRVVIGSADPNPLVNGKGIAKLKNAGIEVTEGVLKEKCDSINQVFFHYVKNKSPYVILKYACTVDGKTALSSGKCEWISSEQSRVNVHRTRSNVMAVMVGINTVISDNPMLNVRLNDGIEHFQPQRIVMDSHLKLPLESSIVKTANKIPVTVCCLKKLSKQEEEKKSLLKKQGIKIIQAKADKAGHINIEETLSILGQSGIDSILVESGGKLASSFLFPPLAQKIQCYICPKIFGASSFTPASILGAKKIEDAVELSKPSISLFENDVLLEYQIVGLAKNASSKEAK